MKLAKKKCAGEEKMWENTVRTAEREITRRCGREGGKEGGGGGELERDRMEKREGKRGTARKDI